MSGKDQTSSCRPEQLLLYHYAELDAADRQRVEQHLQHCSACCSELAELQELLNSVPRQAAEVTPAEVQRFSSRVMENLPPKRRALTRPALGLTLAGAALVLISVNLDRPDQTMPPSSGRSLIKVPAVQGGLPDLELLRNLELLENLDLVERLDRLR